MSDDPLDLKSRLNSFHCAQLCGPLDLTSEVLSDCIREFPMAEEPRRLGIDMYLAFGQPEAAVRLLAGHSKLFVARYTEIIEAFDAKQKAWTLLHDAMRALPENHRFTMSHEKMDAARALYDKDPLIVINLALALRRDRRHEDAARMLEQVVPRLRLRVARACILNVAFCRALAGEQTAADAMFDTAVGLYIHDEAGSPNPFDINCLGQWVEQVDDDSGLVAWVEDPPIAGLQLLQQMGVPRPGSGRERLMHWYDQAATSMATRGGETPPVTL